FASAPDVTGLTVSCQHSFGITERREEGSKQFFSPSLDVSGRSLNPSIGNHFIDRKLPPLETGRLEERRITAPKKRFSRNHQDGEQIKTLSFRTIRSRIPVDQCADFRQNALILLLAPNHLASHVSPRYRSQVSYSSCVPTRSIRTTPVLYAILVSKRKRVPPMLNTTRLAPRKLAVAYLFFTS